MCSGGLEIVVQVGVHAPTSRYEPADQMSVDLVLAPTFREIDDKPGQFFLACSRFSALKAWLVLQKNIPLLFLRRGGLRQ